MLMGYSLWSMLSNIQYEYGTLTYMFLRTAKRRLAMLFCWSSFQANSVKNCIWMAFLWECCSFIASDHLLQVFKELDLSIKTRLKIIQCRSDSKDYPRLSKIIQSHPKLTKGIQSHWSAYIYVGCHKSRRNSLELIGNNDLFRAQW